MMSKEIEDLIVSRATSMAAFDGEPLAPLYALYIVGAANALQADLLAARDNLLKAPTATVSAEVGAPAGPEPEPITEQPAPEPEVIAPVEAEAPADPEPDVPEAPEDPASDAGPEDKAPAK